jgi:hypothetical protein
MKNKRGNAFLGFALGIFIFVMGVLIMPFILDDVDTTRTQLDCTNSSITGGTKINCLFVGSIIPYFILFFTALAVGLIAGGSR